MPEYEIPGKKKERRVNQNDTEHANCVTCKASPRAHVMPRVRVVIDGHYLYLILQHQFTGHQVLERAPHGLLANHKRHCR